MEDREEVFDPDYWADLPAYFDPDYAKTRRYLSWKYRSTDSVAFSELDLDPNLKGVDRLVIDQAMKDLCYTSRVFDLDGEDGAWMK